MANILLLGQPLSESIRLSWGQPAVSEIVLMTAYANFAGVQSVIPTAGLPQQVPKTAVVGITNGVTSKQAVECLLNCGFTVYCVDTGMPNVIFHSKLFITIFPNFAEVFTGSANLTFSGLHNNVEILTKIGLNTSDHSDSECLRHYCNSVFSIIQSYPQNCYIVNHADLSRMTELGLLIDEQRQSTRRVASVRQSGNYTPPPRMFPRILFPPAPQRIVNQNALLPPTNSITFSRNYGRLLWRKVNLPRGDVQLNDTGGNNTGVLRLTQSRFVVGGRTIDQTTYFRHEVFGELAWQHIPERNKEVARANFRIVTREQEMGVLPLDISHKAAWEARQGNYTTAIHWGNATSWIQQYCLIDGTLELFESPDRDADFIISIF